MLARAVAELWAEGRGKVLLFCWLGWVFDFYDLILFAFLKRDVATEFGLDLARDVPWIDGWTLGATALGGFLFGRLADRRGRRWALCASILVYSGGALLTALAGGHGSLLLGRVVTGVGVGGEWGVGHAIVAETYPERLRARAAGVLQAGAPFAMALAAAVACFAGPVIGWRACFLSAALPAGLVFLARLAIPGEDRAPGRARGALADLFRGRLLRPSLALSLLLVLHMTGFWTTYAWLPVHLLRDHSLSMAQVGAFQIVVNTGHLVGDLSFGFLADRYGRRRVFVAYCVACAAGLLAVAFGLDALGAEPVVFALVMAGLGVGFGTWSCFGVLFAANHPPSVRATAASGFYNLARGAQLFTQPAMAFLFAATGTFAVALHVGASMALLSALAIAWVPRVEEAAAGDDDT